MPTQTIADILGQFKAGLTDQQITNAAQAITRAIFKAQNNKKAIKPKHKGKITLEIDFDYLSADKIRTIHKLTLRVPKIGDDDGLIIETYENQETDFYAHPETGYLSPYTINQDDFEIPADPKVRKING